MPQDPLQITDDLTLVWDATHATFAQSQETPDPFKDDCEMNAAQLTASSLVLRHCADTALVKDARKLATAIASVIETACANAAQQERARCLKLASAHSDSEAGRSIITAIQGSIL